ncbi:MAG: 50S ribosomal protein L9 [Planctomycetota bacterium]|nr:50S ribosomal protein L9 [Planctomycetota bacterium]MDA1212527.1 50S ribosomal protein L9 [Planctomycetota bacterium]
MIQQTANDQGVSRKTIEVLLAENVENLGEQGEIVRVRKGYARNFLLPQGLATIATENNKRMVERHRQKLIQIQAERLTDLRNQAAAISKYSVTIEANANAEGHLYGSILAHDISKSLVAAGYAIDADHIRLEGPLKELGMYTVKLELHPEVKTEVKVWVVPAAGK